MLWRALVCSSVLEPSSVYWHVLSCSSVLWRCSRVLSRALVCHGVLSGMLWRVLACSGVLGRHSVQCSVEAKMVPFQGPEYPK